MGCRSGPQLSRAGRCCPCPSHEGNNKWDTCFARKVRTAEPSLALVSCCLAQPNLRQHIFYRGQGIQKPHFCMEVWQSLPNVQGKLALLFFLAIGSVHHYSSLACRCCSEESLFRASKVSPLMYAVSATTYADTYVDICPGSGASGAVAASSCWSLSSFKTIG